MRRDRLLWGIVLTALGIVLLLRQLGILPVAIPWAIIGPLLLIGLGAWVLWGAATRREPPTERLNVRLDGVERARLVLKHGAGRLFVGPAAGPSELLSGTFVGGVRHRITRDGGLAELELRMPEGAAPWMGWPAWGGFQAFTWEVNLNREVAMDLRVETGASQSTLDLVDLEVTDLRVETGASSTHITLPAHAGRVRARIDSGVASTIIRVPEGVAARIRVENGLGDVRVDRERFPRSGGGYESPGYVDAVDAVDLDVHNGVGSVRIE